MRPIAIEGTIGVGKISLPTALEKRGWTVFREPVKEWSDVLTKYYQSTKNQDNDAEQALSIQKHIAECIKRRAERISIARSDRPILMERSLLSGKNIFTRALEEKYPVPEWKEVHDMYQNYIDIYEKSVLHVGLNLPFPVVMMRAFERGKSDVHVGMEYHRSIYHHTQRFFRESFERVFELDPEAERQFIANLMVRHLLELSLNN